MVRARPAECVAQGAEAKVARDDAAETGVGHQRCRLICRVHVVAAMNEAHRVERAQQSVLLREVDDEQPAAGRNTRRIEATACLRTSSGR